MNPQMDSQQGPTGYAPEVAPTLPAPFQEGPVEGQTNIDFALQANIEYRHFLQSQLEAIYRRRQELRVEIEKLQRVDQVALSAQPTKISPERTASLELFSLGSGSRPDDNQDTINRSKTHPQIPLQFRIKKWTDTEKHTLRIAIRQQNRDYLKREALAKYQASAKTDEDKERYETTKKSIDSMDIRELDQTVEQIDWDQVAKQQVMSRSAHECRIRWMNVDAPWINHSEWTKDEDRFLLQLAQQHQGYDWHIIAEQMAQQRGIHRTPTQCFIRYQRHLNSNLTKSKWTDEEDQILQQAVKLYGLKNWGQVANCLEGRTGQQCLHRYQKTLDPDIKKGKWDWEEDRRLQLAVAIYGPGKWSVISAHVPKRTDVQCRERYCNILDATISHEAWTQEEDQRLLQVVEQVGVGKWSEIASIMRNRTDSQCWKRWKALKRDDLEQYQQRIQQYRIISGMMPGQMQFTLPPDVEERLRLAHQHFQQQATALNMTDTASGDEFQRVLNAMLQAGGEYAESAQMLVTPPVVPQMPEAAKA
ncbi:putative snRNA-activating protein complex subunit 4 [Blattamonas nauphoetae]|uniref:snRNA-activating protein complex subunit 4 n=1 Tax=Blattamonas nauphoetae TaxID=2049346 RepID=A0ABQ9Y944_9EUKA|nr:putative snRNA-activating protein complex subunit 4 [Blattamonas nauphoetae]